jgi:hypothetical protein
MTPSTSTLLLLVPLIAWRVWVRIRRGMSRQPLRVARQWIALVLLPIPIGLLLVAGASRPIALVGLCVGLAAGIVLAMWGLRLTRFERDEFGKFWYTPDRYLGTAVALVLLARIGWRMLRGAIGAEGGDDASTAMPSFAHSALSQLVFGLFAGYRLTYALGVLRWRRAQTATPPAAASGSAAASLPEAGPPSAADAPSAAVRER